MKIAEFMRRNFRHFNAASIVEAAQAYVETIQKGGKMLVAIAGAMSTAELGVSLSEMIRQNKVHAICSTGANLEEDLFKLVAYKHYLRVPHWRDLSPEGEVALHDAGMNRVTDTCIPEEEAIDRITYPLADLWKQAADENRRYHPYEYMYSLIRNGTLSSHYEAEPEESWIVAACEANIPIFTPGWEDSTLGNFFVASVVRGDLPRYDVVKSGLEQMEALIGWYRSNSETQAPGLLQVGGGIAGDFATCVVPLIRRDLGQDCAPWGYFCQISDSTTSYGSYSGAVPNEKISWGKLGLETSRFIIESDATIVAPLLFAYILDL